MTAVDPTGPETERDSTVGAAADAAPEKDESMREADVANGENPDE